VARARIDLQGWVTPLLEDVRGQLRRFQAGATDVSVTWDSVGVLTASRQALRKIRDLEAEILKLEQQGQQFESGPGGDRNRLVQRKTSSTPLLEVSVRYSLGRLSWQPHITSFHLLSCPEQQEKSRREHQRKLAKLYKDLAQALQAWQANRGGEPFDTSLLHERVRPNVLPGRTDLRHLSVHTRAGSRGNSPSPTEFPPASAPSSQSPTRECHHHRACRPAAPSCADAPPTPCMYSRGPAAPDPLGRRHS
jgi:hypothetical protein